MNKADFLAATECMTKGWYQTRQGSPPPDQASRFRMQQGREVAEYARQLYPNGTLVGGLSDHAVTHTQALLADEATTTIFEATFAADSFVAKADVLKRNGGGWDVIEIKSSFSDSRKATNEYVDDLAYTVLVLRRSGVTVYNSQLLLLSRDYRYGDPATELFVNVDKTHDVDARTRVFGAAAERIADAVNGEAPPRAVLNPACRSCDFFKTDCLGASHVHTVLELPRLRQAKFQELCTRNIVDIANVPSDFELSDVQERVRAAALSGEMFVGPGLADDLAAIEWPCHYLDFETVAGTMPLYDGHGCHQQVLTQFSAHHRDSLTAACGHSAFLADATACQERLLAESLIDVLGTKGSIVVYGTFEDVRIRELARKFPDLASRLEQMRHRLVDFNKIVRTHIYHPAFAGSFSLKTVVPAIVRDIHYDDLAVGDGDSASAVFALMARGEIDNVKEARQNLLAYCKTDTLVMVRLHEVLVSLRPS